MGGVNRFIQEVRRARAFKKTGPRKRVRCKKQGRANAPISKS